MDNHEQDALLSDADAVLPADEAALLWALHTFTAERLAVARVCRERLLDTQDGAALHAFLRECWEALDGLAREVNVVMHALYPGAGLYPPLEMTRQCTFYVVRKLLHESPETSRHPVAQLLWRETRQAPHPAYRRLSFLYNLSLFVPVAPVKGRLPGAGDVPAYAGDLVRAQQVEGCGLGEGTAEVLDWLNGLVVECYALLGRALLRATAQHGGTEGTEKDRGKADS